MKEGRYRHYKGGEYQVLGIACHSETNEKMVVYRALNDKPDLEKEFGIRPLFVRPYSMFVETVMWEGKEVPRFEYLGE